MVYHLNPCKTLNEPDSLGKYMKSLLIYYSHQEIKKLKFHIVFQCSQFQKLFLNTNLNTIFCL